MDWISTSFRRGRDPLRSAEDATSGTNPQPPPTSARRPTIFAIDDQLSTFRHMVGIHSTRSFGTLDGTANNTHNNLQFDGRAAPNLGIYNRVVHREQESKRGYKFSSFLINGCLGTQIIVAAALTAMGAAGGNRAGVTAFGAINTVIAGLLTYLKGSGLPNRLRYYENEWKKVREYIEQRERDFSRPNCTLDVLEVVRVIELMYEDVKADVQTNTPDSYVSIGDIRNRRAATNPQVPAFPKVTPHANKFQDLESKYGHRIAGILEDLAHKEEARLKQFEQDVVSEKTNGMDSRSGLEHSLDSEVEAGKSRVVENVRELEKEMEAGTSRIASAGQEIEREAEKQTAHITKLGHEIVDEIRIHNHES